MSLPVLWLKCEKLMVRYPQILQENPYFRPSVAQVLSPNGGENWTLGSQQTVSWKAQVWYAGTAYRVDLIRPDGSVAVSNLGGQWSERQSNEPNFWEERSVTITVPNVTAGQYKIRVTSLWLEQIGAPNPSDDSDACFNIGSAEPEITAVGAEWLFYE